MSYDIEIEDEDKIIIYWKGGQFSEHNSGTAELIADRYRGKNIVIDFSHVRSIDSCSMGRLVSLYTKLNKTGNFLELRNLQE